MTDPIPPPATAPDVEQPSLFGPQPSAAGRAPVGFIRRRSVVTRHPVAEPVAVEPLAVEPLAVEPPAEPPTPEKAQLGVPGTEPSAGSDPWGLTDPSIFTPGDEEWAPDDGPETEPAAPGSRVPERSAPAAAPEISATDNPALDTATPEAHPIPAASVTAPSARPTAPPPQTREPPPFDQDQPVPTPPFGTLLLSPPSSPGAAEPRRASAQAGPPAQGGQPARANPAAQASARPPTMARPAGDRTATLTDQRRRPASEGADPDQRTLARPANRRIDKLEPGWGPTQRIRSLILLILLVALVAVVTAAVLSLVVTTLGAVANHAISKSAGT